MYESLSWTGSRLPGLKQHCFYHSVCPGEVFLLQQDPAVATGAGHHSVIHNQKDNSYYIVYHRRPLGETDGNHRVTCVDKLEFDEKGMIKPVKITFEGVPANPLR